MSGGQEAVITILRYTNCFEDEIWLVSLFILLIFIALLLWNIICCGSGKAFSPHYTEAKTEATAGAHHPDPTASGRKPSVPVTDLACQAAPVAALRSRSSAHSLSPIQALLTPTSVFFGTASSHPKTASSSQIFFTPSSLHLHSIPAQSL